MHPQIFIKLLGKELLPGLEDIPNSDKKPILHQAVLALLNGVNRGNLSLNKLLSMGFEVNVTDENGDGALHHIFRASKPVECVRQIFEEFHSTQAYDVDSLMQYLGKHFSFFDLKGYGPRLLLLLA